VFDGYDYGHHQTPNLDSIVGVAWSGDALAALCVRYPGVRDRVFTEQEQVREHINLFVGEEDVRYTGGLMTAVPEARRSRSFLP